MFVNVKRLYSTNLNRKAWLRNSPDYNRYLSGFGNKE